MKQEQNEAPAPERQGELWKGSTPRNFAEARYQSGYMLTDREAFIAAWFFSVGHMVAEQDAGNALADVFESSPVRKKG